MEVVEAVSASNEKAEEVRAEREAEGEDRTITSLPFTDPQAACAAKSTLDLCRSIVVFELCRVRPLVSNAEAILHWSKRIFGSTLVNFGLKHTFYRQFVAGGDGEEIKPTLRYLSEHGVQAILDYAAEDDVEAARQDAPGGEDAASAGAAAVAASASASSSPSSSSSFSSSPADETEDSLREPLASAPVSARTYAYESEAVCDARAAVCLKAIEAAAAGDGQGFAAIKLTALGVPRLLERASTALVAVRGLFAAMDEDGDGLLKKSEFAGAYRRLFADADEDDIEREFDALDAGKDGLVDALEFCDNLPLADMARLASRCREEGPFSRAVLDADELRLLENTLGRVDALAHAARDNGVRLLVDAEHAFLQPVIDHVTARLQATYNRERAVLYNTYQCYRVDSHDRIREDMERARRWGYKFGAKLVRGAYMVFERRHAQALGLPSPIHATIEDTHASYDQAVQMLLDGVQNEHSEVMVATHNQRSVERAVKGLADRGLPPSAPAYFGQLLGMADNLTFVLGANGYGAYKYVPYGTVDEVIPYLVRRAQENSDMLGGVDKELRLMKTELKRRLFG